MKQFILIMMLISFVESSLAGIKVNGVIARRSMPLIAVNRVLAYKHEGTFPLASYDLDHIFISKMEYDRSVDYRDRKINLKDYRIGLATGKLELVSYDTNTQVYKFRLSVLVDCLMNYTVYAPTQLIDLASQLTFTNSATNSIFLEGKATYFNQNVNLTTHFNSDNNVISLAFIDNYNLQLNVLQDIPVSFEINI